MEQILQENRTYTRKEVASIFKVTEWTIDNWRKAGFIKAIRVGRSIRFTPEEVQRVLEKYGTN